MKDKYKGLILILMLQTLIVNYLVRGRVEYYYNSYLLLWGCVLIASVLLIMLILKLFEENTKVGLLFFSMFFMFYFRLILPSLFTIITISSERMDVVLEDVKKVKDHGVYNQYSANVLSLSNYKFEFRLSEEYELNNEDEYSITLKKGFFGVSSIHFNKPRLK